MYFLLNSIDAIIIINANTKKFSISKLSLTITKRMQVKTKARNGIIFFISKLTKNHSTMCVPLLFLPLPPSVLLWWVRIRLKNPFSSF